MPARTHEILIEGCGWVRWGGTGVAPAIKIKKICAKIGELHLDRGARGVVGEDQVPNVGLDWIVQ